MSIEKEFELNGDKLDIRIFKDKITFFILDGTNSPDWWKPLPLGNRTDEIVEFINKHYKIKKSKPKVRRR